MLAQKNLGTRSAVTKVALERGWTPISRGHFEIANLGLGSFYFKVDVIETAHHLYLEVGLPQGQTRKTELRYSSNDEVISHIESELKEALLRF